MLHTVQHMKQGRPHKPANENALRPILRVFERSFMQACSIPPLLLVPDARSLENESAWPVQQTQSNYSILTKEKTYIVNYAGLIIIVAENDYSLISSTCNVFSSSREKINNDK